MTNRLWTRLPLLVVLLGAPACAHRRSADLPAPVRFSHEVRQLLNHRESSPEYYRGRMRLEQMGPEVDAVLVMLARDPEVRTVVRGNALTLLADRRSPAAIPVLRRVLLAEPDEDVRAAAVLAVQRLVPDSPEAANLLRAAVGDPSRTVRLNALQGLDARDVESIRALLARESDPEVRKVAQQLVAIAESRGAALAADRRGALRTTGGDGDPQIVLRPVRSDSVGGYIVGDLRVELPIGPDIPLAPLVEAVGGVVPAFFSPDRSRVVFETEREIRVVSLGNRRIRSLGPGIAPRPVPFSNQFVFLRPVAVDTARSAGRSEIRYAVYRAGFNDGEPEWLGEMRVTVRPDRFANYSPVRWMVVTEGPEGLILKGDGFEPFALPAPAWQPGTPGGPGTPRHHNHVDGGTP